MSQLTTPAVTSALPASRSSASSITQLVWSHFHWNTSWSLVVGFCVDLRVLDGLAEVCLVCTRSLLLLLIIDVLLMQRQRRRVEYGWLL